MGPLSRREMILGVLVLFAILMWIFGGHYVEATTAALIVLALMLLTRIVTWDDMAANKAAWTTLSLLALLAGGLSRTGFVKWFADCVATHMGGLSPTPALLALAGASWPGRGSAFGADLRPARLGTACFPRLGVARRGAGLPRCPPGPGPQRGPRIRASEEGRARDRGGPNAPGCSGSGTRRRDSRRLGTGPGSSSAGPGAWRSRTSPCSPCPPGTSARVTCFISRNWCSAAGSRSRSHWPEPKCLGALSEGICSQMMPSLATSIDLAIPT